MLRCPSLELSATSVTCQLMYVLIRSGGDSRAGAEGLIRSGEDDHAHFELEIGNGEAGSYQVVAQTPSGRKLPAPCGGEGMVASEGDGAVEGASAGTSHHANSPARPGRSFLTKAWGV